MPSTSLSVALSPLEKERFGIRTARADRVTLDALPDILGFCRSEKVELLIARCKAEDLPAAQALEAEGGQLMDTLVYYGRDTQKDLPTVESSSGSMRSSRAGDEEALARVAMQAFRGYSGHYHADPRLNRAKCDEVYASWTRRSCSSRDVAGEVLVYELDGEIAGFATLRLNSAEEGEGVLFGVAPQAQGRGVYKLLIVRGLEWCKSQGARRMVVSTQVTNLAVQKVWVRTGFEPLGATYTFHKWFSEA